MSRGSLRLDFAVATVVVLLAACLSGSAFGVVRADDAGYLHVAREDHAATLLSDGRVLISGGSDGDAEPASLEVIEPRSGSVSLMGELLLPRRGHTATLLPDGRVLIAGGRSNGSTVATAEVLQPATSASSKVGQMRWPRAAHSATLLPDGRVLISGGLDGDKAVGRAEVFDPATGEFAKVAKPESACAGSAATLLPDGRVLVTGTATKPGSKPACTYDPVLDRWATPEGWTANRVDHTSTLLPDGRVLLAGGAIETVGIGPAEAFDPATGASSSVGDLTDPRSQHTATLLPDGRVVILGGASSGIEVSSIELIDPRIGGFSVVGELDVPRTKHTATQLQDGEILVVGGIVGTLVLDDILVFDPDEGLLSLLTDDTGEPDEGTVAVDTRTDLDIRARYGAPDAFAILYFDEQGTDGTVATVTMSRWSYYDEGVEFSFAGDLVVAQDPLELQPGSTAERVPYDPDQFHAYMSLDEVLEAAGLEDYVGGPLEAVVEGGELFFADRLTWGIKDGELRYVEAIALDAEVAGTENTE